MFRNRGEIPTINTNTSEGGGFSAPHYSHYWNGRIWIINYDKSFIIIELITSLIIILTALAVYLFAYPIAFEDPIATMKNNFLTYQLVIIGVSIIATGLTTFCIRSSKEKMIKSLRIIATISIVMILISFGIKIHIDKKYNSKNAFEQLYEQYEQGNNKQSSKVYLKLSGFKVLDPKDTYVEECINAYTNFSIKAILYMIIHLLTVVVIFYLSYRLSTIERKREKLTKDDEILYDEEENVKY